VAARIVTRLVVSVIASEVGVVAAHFVPPVLVLLRRLQLGGPQPVADVGGRLGLPGTPLDQTPILANRTAQLFAAVFESSASTPAAHALANE
jgi:hypothetical protein